MHATYCCTCELQLKNVRSSLGFFGSEETQISLSSLPSPFLNVNNRWRCDLPKYFFALKNYRIVKHSCNSCNFCQCKIVPVVLYQRTSSPGLDFMAVHLMKFKIKIKSIAKSSAGRTIFQRLSHQLKSFAQPRINLSPFTKDFRVRETQIEHESNFS